MCAVVDLWLLIGRFHWQTEDVRVVVTNTFTADVIQNDKDVLVEFYAPWCSHCKELKPHYDALALKLKHVETVVIAKVTPSMHSPICAALSPTTQTRRNSAPKFDYDLTACE